MYQLILAATLLSTNATASILVKEIISGTRVQKKEVVYSEAVVSGPVVLRDLPLYMGEEDFTSKEIYRETLYPSVEMDLLLTKEEPVQAVRGSEMRTIIKQGPDANRIIITVIGDGYTEAEKEKYFKDVQVMVSDLFQGVTFKSYLPFFNIYAVFTPSQESGITDVVKKKTAFGLYRSPAGSKRGIMPGNSSAMEQALKLAPAAAHYPIVIANDPYYGGLGGRYAITTNSIKSGSVVLRHELGHNFSNVGEEYDGGQVYSGANFSNSPSGAWDHWKVSSTTEKHEAKHLFGAYVWKPLTQPFVQKFKTDNKIDLFKVNISSVGWDTEGEVEVLLDGKPLELEGDYTMDRSFFDSVAFPLQAGDHELVIRSNGNKANHVLAFARGYGYPVNYDLASGEVKAFNVFDEGQSMRGYRPTEKMCLMRDMTSKVFCPVDQENIWLQFLKRVNLIDSLAVANGKAELKTLPIKATDLDISWFDGEKEIVEYKGLTSVPAGQKGSKLKVLVKVISSEVRKASEHFQDEKAISF